MILCGTAGRKMPYGRVNVGDVPYLLENDGSGKIRAKTKVGSVFNSEKMDPGKSIALVEKHQDCLQLTGKQLKRWAGKRYLVLIEIKELETLDPFPIDKSDYGNMDDWLPVSDINNVKIK